jgi:hypothetical protein
MQNMEEGFVPASNCTATDRGLFIEPPKSKNDAVANFGQPVGNQRQKVGITTERIDRSNTRFKAFKAISEREGFEPIWENFAGTTI